MRQISVKYILLTSIGVIKVAYADPRIGIDSNITAIFGIHKIVRIFFTIFKIFNFLIVILEIGKGEAKAICASIYTVFNSRTSCINSTLHVITESDYEDNQKLL